MIRELKLLNYRIKLRKALQQASIEELQITKEECKKEYERRTKHSRKNANSSNH